ncbi:hypothetical protein V8F20_010077 [Naviculisporaceae sp. PSN 640]
MTHALASCAILVVAGASFSYARVLVMTSTDEWIEEDGTIHIMTGISTDQL